MKEENKALPPRVRVTNPVATQKIGEDLLYGVVLAAVWSEGRRPGICQDMTKALCQGASKTKTGSVNDFLFQAMVDRLLEEFHALESSFAD